MSETDKVHVLLGPPGTGKTRALLDEIEALLASGVPAGTIAFVSYTRAAVHDARDRASERFGIHPDEFQHFRTIHSMAYQAIGAGPVMSSAHWNRFGEIFSYSFSEQGGDPTLNFARDGDALRTLHELHRVKRCSTAQAILHAGDVPPHITTEMLRLFAERLTDWKRTESVIDFTDMLELSLASNWRPPVRFAFIDETQDNSRLQNILTKKWFWLNKGCERVTYAGDDDQAIYGWSGGDRQALAWLASRCETRILDQSYRVPRRAQALALAIIGENRSRVDKSYRPRDDDGDVRIVESADEALSESAGDTFILVRNVMFAHAHREACLTSGKLFSCEVGEAAPLDRRDAAGAFRVAATWRRGGNATAADLAALLALVPSYLNGQAVIPHGMKAAAKRNENPVPVWRAREEFKLGMLVDSLLRDDEPFSLAKRLPPEERAYLARVLARDPSLRGDRTVVTTIHRSKGRESSCVILSPDMAYRTHRRWTDGPQDGREEERSVQYVAVTRTRRTLIIERPTEQRYFDVASYMRTRAA